MLHQLQKTGLVVAALLLPLAMRAEDWPQWRGLNRDGVWSETGILESFPAGGLKIGWRASVGPGWSSPVVAQGRVCVTDSELMPPKAKERVHCFDAATGKSLWTFSYEVSYPDWAFTDGLGPTATPIVQTGKVYTLGKKGDLICLDARNGEVLWKTNLEKQYDVQEFCTSASPLIEGHLLIVPIGSYVGTSGSFVIAFDKDSGKEIWKSPNDGLTYSSPIVITTGGKRQLIVWTQKSVISLDPAAGKTYWRVSLTTGADYAVSTPVLHNDRLLIGGLMLKLDLDKPDASVLWPESRAVSRRVLSNTSTALLQGDCAFSARSSGELVCLEASTGNQVWKTDKVTDLKQGASIHLTPNGDGVFLYTDKGELIRAHLTAKGYEEISRTRLIDPTYPFAGRKVAWPPPAFANRCVFVRNDKEIICASLASAEAAMPWVRIADDQHGFLLENSGRSFIPWGFNYDHDENGRLLEDYWDKEWPKLEQDFREMKQLGANVVRIHLQVGKFMGAATQRNQANLDRLGRLATLAETIGIYLDITGLACYRKKDVPKWYDDFAEKEHWDVQARFWEAVAERCVKSPAIFCYDLMNEPVVPGGTRTPGEWLGPPFLGMESGYFVQFITLEQKDRPRPEIARQWCQKLVAAIRKHDQRHLVTVGLVPWSLDRPGLTSGFVPQAVAPDLDFIAVHLYPEKAKLKEAMETLSGFAVGKPVIIEEMFPLNCSFPEFERFLDESKNAASGWIGFYWGKTAEEYRKSNSIENALMLGWLEIFQKRAKAFSGTGASNGRSGR